jgi:potassium large conductance calcium-activated channel subfamily M alpha protein 1
VSELQPQYHHLDHSLAENAKSDRFSTWNHSLFLQVAGLEQAVERLLAWPPVSDYGRPTGAVIEKQEAKILANLKERTLTVVGQEKGPLILVCIPNSPPDGLYHFLAELRDDRVPFRNVVILHPTEPGATLWGNAGLFEGVYFVKGSPMYELDLLRAGVLQAGELNPFS